MAHNTQCNRCDIRNTPLVSGGNWYDWLCKPCLAIVSKPPTSNRQPTVLANLLKV